MRSLLPRWRDNCCAVHDLPARLARARVGGWSATRSASAASDVAGKAAPAATGAVSAVGLRAAARLLQVWGSFTVSPASLQVRAGENFDAAARPYRPHCVASCALFFCFDWSFCLRRLGVCLPLRCREGRGGFGHACRRSFLCFSLCLAVSLSLCLSVSLTLCLFVSLSLSLSVSLPLYE